MTPEQYLVELEHLSLSNQFQAVLDFTKAHSGVALTLPQSLQAEAIVTHAFVQLNLEAFFGRGQSTEITATREGMSALAAEPRAPAAPAHAKPRQKQAG